MFKKLFLSFLVIVSIFPYKPAAEPLKLTAAFVRENDLWIKTGNQEHKITEGIMVRNPKWSTDGKWIAYLKYTNISEDGDLWVYNLKQNKHFNIKANVRDNFQWSPKENKVGFLIKNELFVTKITPTSQFSETSIATKIDNFSWLPDGKGLLISSKKNNQLNSDILLTKVFLDTGKPMIKPFYTIPVGKNEIYVGTSSFKWSYDHKWISFLMTPTASISADSNTLCILSSDGKIFRRIDEMLDYSEWIQWAPRENVLGFISGIGREANFNKKFSWVSAGKQQLHSLSSHGFSDQDIYWKNNRIVLVARSVENKQAGLNKRPTPRLFEFNTSNGKQKQITFPIKKEGDYAPQFMDHQLVWFRTDGTTANILISSAKNINGSKWIQNLTLPSSYYGKWYWNEVFSIYEEE